MTHYRVTKDSYLDNVLRKAGEVVEYDGPAGTNLERISEKQAEKLKLAKQEAAAPQPSTYEHGRTQQRLDDLELTVGKEAIAAAVKKRDEAAAAATKKAADEKKAKDDADAKARATAAKAKADAEAKEDAKLDKQNPSDADARADAASRGAAMPAAQPVAQPVAQPFVSRSTEDQNAKV